MFISFNTTKVVAAIPPINNLFYKVFFGIMRDHKLLNILFLRKKEYL
jgi:hypothetical protein